MPFWVGYTAPNLPPPQQPPKSKVIESTPKKPEELPSNQPKKFWCVPEVYKMTKVLEDGRENG